MSKEHFRKKNKARSSEGLFLDSWSGLSEYIARKPERIKRIECPEKELDRLSKMLEGLAQKIEVIPSSESLRVFVKEDFQSEIDLEQTSYRDRDVLLALDHITDTRNLGAIIRSAAFFGIRSIVVPSKRQAPIAQGTLSTCQGALAHTNVFSVVNLVRTLRALKKQGFWIVGADMGGEPMDRYDTKFDKVVLVMGSEEKGLSRIVRAECDVIVSIPGSDSGVESLNVAVASGILIQSFTKSFLSI